MTQPVFFFLPPSFSSNQDFSSDPSFPLHVFAFTPRFFISFFAVSGTEVMSPSLMRNFRYRGRSECRVPKLPSPSVGSATPLAAVFLNEKGKKTMEVNGVEPWKRRRSGDNVGRVEEEERRESRKKGRRSGSGSQLEELAEERKNKERREGKKKQKQDRKENKQNEK
ncbi:unnamed protein product [Cuscuta epithymum]|uniref:Uncharacterized protein n=1 Tax=Cuscuta epithymum TaxID=186058 RepID=A0AAV0FGJ4_9ASTE|nr:unnamed protein product [Cuscuta epithymum]